LFSGYEYKNFLKIATPSLKKAHENGSIPKVKIELNINTYEKAFPWSIAEHL
jgi:hypothetical protein